MQISSRCVCILFSSVTLGNLMMVYTTSELLAAFFNSVEGFRVSGFSC